MAQSSICVLGGGGFVGSHLVALLSARGHRVVVPTRRRERCKPLFLLPGVEVVEANVNDPAILKGLFVGMDAVINLVGILHERPPVEFQCSHEQLPRKVAEACVSLGVTRLLHMSALSASADSRSRYQRSKHAGEVAVLGTKNLRATVFRPSVIFGPGDSFLTLFAGLLKLAPVLPLAGASARFQPVYVGDVARAFADALDDRASYGRALDLCGPRVYTLAELVELTAASLGLKRCVLPLGATASYWFARLMELKPGSKLMTRDNHYAMLSDNVCGADQNCAGATPLESVIGYLREADARRSYMRFRAHAGR
jgi:NADH dehydrogenase